jgi:hypothetical protein
MKARLASLVPVSAVIAVRLDEMDEHFVGTCPSFHRAVSTQGPRLCVIANNSASVTSRHAAQIFSCTTMQSSREVGQRGLVYGNIAGCLDRTPHACGSMASQYSTSETLIREIQSLQEYLFSVTGAPQACELCILARLPFQGLTTRKWEPRRVKALCDG